MSQFSTPVPATPPQYAGQIPAQPSSWPTVIGIILIVIASLGLLMNVCGGVMTAIMPALMDQAAQSASSGSQDMVRVQIDILQKYMAWTIASVAVMLVLSVIMLVGGIGIARRRQSGVRAARLWAVLRIIWAIPASYLGYVISTETFRAMEQAAADSGQAMPGGMMTFMQSMGVIGTLIGFIIVCVLPAFILIWFSLASIKREVATWS